MSIFDFATEEMVYAQCHKHEEEMKGIIFRLLNFCGNRYDEDCLQDVYIKAMSIFLNSNLLSFEFKEKLLQLTTDTAFEYRNEEKKNLAPPSPYEPKDEEDSFKSIWNVIKCPRSNPEEILVAKEELQKIKDYKGKWMSLNQAKEFVSCLQLKDLDEWINWCKNNHYPNIPINPDVVYSKFKSWDDWLGITYLNWEDCQTWVQNNLSLTSIEDWNNIIDTLPSYVPKRPNVYYKKQFNDWNSFLGLGKGGVSWLPYRDAQKWVEDNIETYELSESIWIEKISKGEIIIPKNIPPNPDVVYRYKGWSGWFVWFGKQNIKKKLWPSSYFQCAKWVKNNLSYIHTKSEWERFCLGEYVIKKPSFIPPNPDVIFRGIGWHGWDSFLNNNGLNKAHLTHLFGTNHVKIMYEGEKIWVKPISMYKETVTAKVITIFCKCGKDAEITFHASDIIGLKANGISKTKNIIKTKYGI